MKKSVKWAVTLVSLVAGTAGAEVFWGSPVTVYSGGTSPQIAVKGNTPVIAFSQQAASWQVGYTEDLGQNVTPLGPAWGGYFPDIAVDAGGNTHLVWCWQNSNNNWNWEVYYQAQINGSFSGTAYELVSDNDHIPWVPGAMDLFIAAGLAQAGEISAGWERFPSSWGLKL
jgi:hypothetical protein